MASIVKNIVETDSELIDELLSKDEESGGVTFDFDKWCPMPAGVAKRVERINEKLRKERLKRNSMMLDKSISDRKKEKMSIGVHTNVYLNNWRMKNWGVSRKVFDTERISPNVFVFETAWYHPHILLQHISRKFPEILLRVSFVDEDNDDSMKIYQLKNGEVIE